MGVRELLGESFEVSTWTTWPPALYKVRFSLLVSCIYQFYTFVDFFEDLVWFGCPEEGMWVLVIDLYILLDGPYQFPDIPECAAAYPFLG